MRLAWMPGHLSAWAHPNGDASLMGAMLDRTGPVWQIDPRMKTSETAAAGSYRFGQFARNAAELERLKLQATVALPLEQEIWRRAGLAAGMQVLDLGCGPGFTSCALAQCVGAGAVTGIDISGELIAVAEQAKASEQVENVVFQTGNLYDLDFPAERFDFVYARFVFQHLKDPERALQGVLRVLKPGGILCVVDVDDNWTSFSPASAAFIRFIRRAGRGQRRKGGNRLIGSQLHGLLHRAGLSDVTVAIHPLTTEDIGVRMFMGVAVLFRLEMLTRLQKLLVLPQLRRIKSAASDPQAWGAVGIFAASGRRPP
jgi:ubiquinone/menaquinone biosynthesis C-methylase UbiE